MTAVTVCMTMFQLFFSRITYAHYFDIKVQVFSCKRMVSINGNRFIVNLRDFNRVNTLL